MTSRAVRLAANREQHRDGAGGGATFGYNFQYDQVLAGFEYDFAYLASIARRTSYRGRHYGMAASWPCAPSRTCRG